MVYKQQKVASLRWRPEVQDQGARMVGRGHSSWLQTPHHSVPWWKCQGSPWSLSRKGINLILEGSALVTRSPPNTIALGAEI